VTAKNERKARKKKIATGRIIKKRKTTRREGSEIGE